MRRLISIFFVLIGIVMVSGRVAPVYPDQKSEDRNQGSEVRSQKSEQSEIRNPKSAMVRVIRADGVIDPIVAGYIIRNIKQAEEDKAECLIIEMDTPGGLMDSMHDIVKGILNARVPIVVYVSPRGAKAASAGTFITLAAHVAAMSPSTNIGAAHPVQMGQKIEDEELGKKILNDALSTMESIAGQRGRNLEWAKLSVSESVSITEVEALEKKVIDLVADDREDLIKKLDGTRVYLDPDTVTLKTEGATVTFSGMNFRDNFLHAIANPNIAYVLLILGIYGLIYEFASPGIGLGAVAGGICLILAFFALQTLPINLAGLLLIILGIILLILEIKVASYGVLALGGITALTLGSFMLIDTASAPFFIISRSLIIGVVGLTSLFILFAVAKVLEVHQKQVTTGEEGLIGAIGYTKEDFVHGKGMIYVDGAYWTGMADEDVSRGTEVKVVEVVGPRLRVSQVK
ncbi:MAG: nodulation protein NfeD [bacterium]|nr:nodulation protein NfeD [bacterium]